MFKKDSYDNVIKIKKKLINHNRPFYDKGVWSVLLVAFYMFIDAFCKWSTIDRLANSSVYIVAIIVLIIAGVLDITPVYLARIKDENRPLFYGLLGCFCVFFLLISVLSITSLYDQSNGLVVSGANYETENTVSLSTIIYNVILCIISGVTSILSYYSALPNDNKEMLDRLDLLVSSNDKIKQELQCTNSRLNELKALTELDIGEWIRMNSMFALAKNRNEINQLYEKYLLKVTKRLNTKESIDKLLKPDSGYYIHEDEDRFRERENTGYAEVNNVDSIEITEC